MNVGKGPTGWHEVAKPNMKANVPVDCVWDNTGFWEGPHAHKKWEGVREK